MEEVFTTFATSRFINSEKVVQELRECAGRLIDNQVEVVAVHLFGSFASGSATPRSDADIVIETISRDSNLADAARRIFESALVPVELFLFTPDELRNSKGVAAVTRREGIVLAMRSTSRFEG